MPEDDGQRPAGLLAKWQLWQVYLLIVGAILVAAIILFIAIRATVKRCFKQDSARTWHQRHAGQSAVDSSAPYEELKGSYKPRLASMQEVSRSSSCICESPEIDGTPLNMSRHHWPIYGRNPSRHGKYDLMDRISNGREDTLKITGISTNISGAIGGKKGEGFGRGSTRNDVILEGEKLYAESWKPKFGTQTSQLSAAGRTAGRTSIGSSSGGSRPGSVVLAQHHRDSCYSTMSESSGALGRGLSMRSSASEGKKDPSATHYSGSATASHLAEDPPGQLVFSVEFTPLVSFRGRLRMRIIEGIDLPGRPYGGLPSTFVEVRLIKWDQLDKAATVTHDGIAKSQKGATTPTPSSGVTSTGFFSHFMAQRRNSNDSNKSKLNESSQQQAAKAQLEIPDNMEDRPKSPVIFSSRTETIKKTRNPSFDQVLEAELNVSDITDTSLQLTVYDDDKYGNPTVLGMTSYSIPKEDFQANIGRSILLRNCIIPTTVSRGTMQISLNYMPTAKRLVIGITRCTQLTLTNGDFSSIDFFVKAFLLTASGQLNRRRKSNSVPISKETPSEVQMDETLIFNLAPSQLESVTALLVLFARKSMNSSSPSAAPRRLANTKNPHASPMMTFLQSPVQLIAASGCLSSTDAAEADNSVNSPDNVDGATSSRSTSEDNLLPSTNQYGVKKSNKKLIALGKIAVGSFVTRGKGQEHWRKMADNPRTQVVEWHAMF